MVEKLQSLLTNSAERAPEAPVFIGAAGTTTYAELARRSGRFAAGLRRIGLGRGDRVAVLIDGHVDYLVAYYGAAKAGCVVVPLSAETRQKPLCHALRHSGARAVVLDGENARYLSGQAGSLPELQHVVLRKPEAIEDAGHFALLDIAELHDGGAELHDGGAGGDDLLSIVYTSGTTGEPKGVMLSHRNLVANVRSIVSYLELDGQHRVAMVLPFHYVYGNSVLHTHVAAGASIVHIGDTMFPAAVIEAMQTHACTGLSGVPATFARLLSAEKALASADLAGIRYLTQAGAAMTPALTQKLRAAFPRARIFVMYGQTEAAARLAYVPPEDLDRKLGSAGRAIPGVSLRITDPDGRELPRGTEGEVVARGDNVMLGYWNDPEGTARVLRPEGLRTGDVGHMDEEGFIYLVGRQSDIIKVGGHRISPLEVEAALQTVPGVRECGVVGVPDALMGQAIAAYVVPAEGAALDRRKLLAGCFAELPRFKLPQHLFIVERLPHTTSGKVRRIELREWFQQNLGLKL
jgi:long-chain acyl-CoA synthetase